MVKQIDFSNYDYLCGIALGGLPTLTKLSNVTKKPYIIVKCSSYEGHTQKVLHVNSWEINLPRNQRVLIVDDIADTGKTLKRMTEELYAKYATSVEVLTLFYKPHSIVVPEWYAREVENHQWIEFPWE